MWPHKWAENPQSLFHNTLKSPLSSPSVLSPMRLFQFALFSHFASSMYTLEGKRALSVSSPWLLVNCCLQGCIMTLSLRIMNHQEASSYGCYGSNMNTCTSRILCNQFNVSPTPVHKWGIKKKQFCFGGFFFFWHYMIDSFTFYQI